jgi:hypothetical protein
MPPFAVICDVAATWSLYPAELIAPDGGAPDLLLHVAGTTDDGFRTIDVWASREAWEHNGTCVENALPDLSSPPVVRYMRVRHIVMPGARPALNQLEDP